MTASGSSVSSPVLRLCRRRRVVIAGTQEVRLPDLSFRLLDLLASRAPGDVSYDEIERIVWNARVTRETIKQRVKLLRESLAPLGVPESTIEAVRNVGYRATLEIGVLEPRLGRPNRRLAFALVAVIIVAVATATIAMLARSPDTISPPTLIVESAAPPAGVDPVLWDGARRMLVRDLSKVEGIRVVDRGHKIGRRQLCWPDLRSIAVTPGHACRPNWWTVNPVRSCSLKAIATILVGSTVRSRILPAMRTP